MAGRAARRRRRPTCSAASAPRTAAASRRRWPGPRRCSEQGEHAAAAQAFADGRAGGRRDRRAPTSSCARCSARRGRSPSQGGVREALRLLERARDLAERPGVLRRRPRGRPLPARRLPLPPVEHLDRDLAADLGARARRPLRACRATCCAATSSTGVPAATAASATGRRPARTSSARSSWPSPARDRRCVRPGVLPGVARRRAGGALAARAGPTRSGRAATTRSWRTGPTSAGS